MSRHDLPPRLRRNREERTRQALREYKAATVSASDLRAPTAWLNEWYSGGITTAGQHINPETALSVSAYWGCANAISSDIGKLPAGVFTESNDRREETKTHPAYWVVHEEWNPLMAAGLGFEWAVFAAVTQGNACAYIVRDGSNRVREMWPIESGGIRPKLDGRRLRYLVRTDAGDEEEVDPGNIWHLRGPGSMIWGHSIARIARESIGLTASAEQFGASFFGNDATMGVTMETPMELNPEQRKAFTEQMQAVQDRRFRFMVLPGGVKATRTMVPPEDIQFLETRQFQIEEICRWFRMPPHKIQHLLRATFSNIEHQAIEYVGDTLGPWIRRIEQECNRKFFHLTTSRTNFYVKFNVNALLRSDYATRIEGFTKQINVGMMTIDEARSKEDMNPLPNGLGKKPLVQGAMKPLEDALDPPEPPAPPAGLMPPAPDEGGEDDDEDTSTAAQFFPVFFDAASRCIRREIHAMSGKHKGPDAVWTTRFYAGHRDYVAGAFQPIFDSVGHPPRAHVVKWVDDTVHEHATEMGAGREARLADLRDNEQDHARRLADGAMGIAKETQE